MKRTSRLASNITLIVLSWFCCYSPVEAVIDAAPSELSIALLKADVFNDPNNGVIRLELIKQLASVGQYHEAYKHLQRLTSESTFTKKNPSYFTVSIKVYWGLYMNGTNLSSRPFLIQYFPQI